MTSVAVLSAKGAPGATTLACALGAVWPRDRDVRVAECDPAGGDLGARFSLPTEIGMTSLVLALRSHHGSADPCSPVDHVQQLPGGLHVLVGPVGADAAVALDRELAAVPVELLAGQADVILDCGRLGSQSTGQRRMVCEADRVVLVARPDAGSIAHGRWAAERVAALRPTGMPPALVLVGTGVFRPEDVAGAVGTGMLGVVPDDGAAAAMLAGEPGTQRALARSSLVVAAKRLVRELLVGVDVEEWRDAS